MLVIPGLASSADFEEGKAYKRIIPKVPTESNGKSEVVEIFWYGCPHCYNLEADLNKWLKSKPENVAFRRIPAIFPNRPAWAFHAQVYYTAEALELLDKTHASFFERIHELKKPMQTEEEIAAFFAEFGIGKKDFDSAWKSFAVNIKVKRARELTQRYNINAVPTLIVNGEFQTGNSLSGSSENTFAVINQLTQR
jgi:thiol:disulfide interchange protein DsbA